MGERHAPLFHVNTPILHLYLLSIPFLHSLASISWFSCISCSELLVIFVENTLLLHLYLFGELLGCWVGSENVACGSGIMKKLA